MLRRLAALIAAAATALASTGATAAAEPATPVTYAPSATTTQLTGPAFDMASAPSIAAMQAWTASPYDGVIAYIGGINRYDPVQANLTVNWVAAVSRMPWRIVPVYMGLQPSCTTSNKKYKFTASTAATQGTAAANDAISRASALGLREGSAFYLDIEPYTQTDDVCRRSVLTYVSSWTKRLHAKGYVAGVYENLNFGAKQLSDAYPSTSYARPDALWIARYDNNPSLLNWTLLNGQTIPNSRWSEGQRAKQYLGEVTQTYGGVTMTVDKDNFDAPVATVSMPYTVTTVSTPLSSRTGPSYSYAAVGTHAPGSTLYARCQIEGQTVKTNPLWDKLNNGTYVPDAYVSTPPDTPLPQCLLPYQTTATAYQRSGPGNEFSLLGSMPAGSLARVQCQATGSIYASTTTVWNKLDDGSWVTDHRVATPSTTSFSAPIPRCA